MNARRSAVALIATVAASAALATSGPAYASGGSDDHGRHGGGKASVVRASHSCSTGVIKLKAKHDDGRIEVETEVDTNRKGQTWSVQLRHNGVSVFKGKRTALAPSGSF